MRIKSIDKQVESLEPWSLVEVTWRDAYDASNGWTETETYKPEDQIAITVGYVWVGCQKHYITLCGTFFLQELPKVHTIGNVTHVPIAMIQSLRVINKQQKGEHNGRIQVHSKQARTRKPRVADSTVER
jgi:hypothetical protein